MTHYDQFREQDIIEQEFMRAITHALEPPKNTDSQCRQKIIDMIQEVINDTMQVFDFGARKHPDTGDTPNFLTKNGNKCALKERGSSVLRHAARTFMHPEALDEESNLNELLHLISSAAILYIRNKRNIIHPEDVE